MKSARKTVIFIMGRPGSGKDTQAEFLAKRFDLVHIVTSNLLQEKFMNFPEGGEVKREKELFDGGILNTPSWVVGVVKEKISELAARDMDGQAGIIFSGSPRTLYEAENLVPFLERLFGLENMKAVYLDVAAEEAIRRILLRGARELDKDPEKLKVRMREYEERTKPVLDYLKDRNMLVTVDGRAFQEEVFKDVLQTLKSFFSQ